MNKFFPIIFLGFLFQGFNSLIIPDEVPSLLSLIYSNIPPIKKGTDSRVGWGFRLGDHADFQVIVELGPQTNTRPLGNENSNNKRNVANNLRNTLYAQKQLNKQQISNTDGGKWIQSWSSMMSQSPSADESDASAQEGIGEINAAAVIPTELEELYGANGRTPKTTTDPVTSTEKVETTSTKFKTTTDPKDALDNVDLE